MHKLHVITLLYLNAINTYIFTMWYYIFVFFYASDVAHLEASDQREKKQFNLSPQFSLTLRGTRRTLTGDDLSFENVLILVVHLRSYNG